MKPVLSHVAFLVPNVIKSAEYLKQFDFKVGPAEKWDGEGTLEIYIGDLTSETANLLLMEPVKDGAYSRAMAKRGPGLHHIAIDVPDLESYIDGLSGSGWLLHPKSLKTIKQSLTAYMARPGIPTLIEVQECDELKILPPFITGIKIPLLSEKSLKMFSSLGLSQIQSNKTDDLTVVVHEKNILCKDFFL